jgi:hypothetical protein
MWFVFLKRCPESLSKGRSFAASVAVAPWRHFLQTSPDDDALALG